MPPTADQQSDPEDGHVPSRAAKPARVSVHRGEVTGAERERLAAGVGKRLRSLRTGMEWSQATLACVARVDAETVKSLELGRRRPEYGTMVRLVRVLVNADDRPAVLGELEALAGESWRCWKRKSQPSLMTTRDARGLPPKHAPATKAQRDAAVAESERLRAKVAAMRKRLRPVLQEDGTLGDRGEQ